MDEAARRAKKAREEAAAQEQVIGFGSGIDGDYDANGCCSGRQQRLTSMPSPHLCTRGTMVVMVPSL